MRQSWRENAKIHAVVDALGNPIQFLLSAGQAHDSKMAIALLEEVDIQGSNVIGDKGYCNKAILTYINERGANCVIVPKKPVEAENPIDWHLYKERHLIECFFNKMKQFRRVCTRYDKLSTSFLSFVYLVSISILLR